MSFKKTLVFLLALVLLSSMAQVGLALESTGKGTSSSGTYLDNLNHAYARGLKNIIASPAEVYIGVRDAKTAESKCPAGGKYVVGFFKGLGKVFCRLGSGIGDLVAGWVPGYQQGWPLNPEVLF